MDTILMILLKNLGVGLCHFFYDESLVGIFIVSVPFLIINAQFSYRLLFGRFDTLLGKLVQKR